MIERLFTSKNRVKIIGFLLFKNSNTYLREISKELKISTSAVKREIENLALLGIIEINKNRIILNEKCLFLSDLKNIFIKTDFIIYPLKELISNQKVKYAFIFGSFARGTYTLDSDVDLMVIGNLKLSEVYKSLKPLENKTNRDIVPVVWTIDNLKKEKGSGFVKDIFTKSIIMIKGDENELRKIIE